MPVQPPADPPGADSPGADPPKSELETDVKIQPLSQSSSVSCLAENAVEKSKTLEELLGTKNLQKLLGQPLTAETLHLLLSTMKLPGAVATDKLSWGP